MKVFKFGGASVKDGAAVRNVSHILSLFGGEKRTVIISAMGKTTNEMEKIVEALWKFKHYQRSFQRKTLFNLYGS